MSRFATAPVLIPCVCVLFVDEEALQHKMLAFKEMRKRLEEQHAQELSLLIAEQEREQERLHKVRGQNAASKPSSMALASPIRLCLLPPGFFFSE